MDAPATTIKVLYFAAASTAVQKTEEVVDIPSNGFPLSSLADLLVSKYPNTELKSILDKSRWSVDVEMVDDPSNVQLKGGEEVAVICPVSGG